MTIAAHKVSTVERDPNRPHRDTPIWDLADALQQQYAEEQPFDRAMVIEAVTRAILAEYPDSLDESF